ncbi:MAG: EamA family transporter [Spirochaetales bacterium]|nr:EamA family transporter [Spirochaetales bacterium]
MNTGVFLLVLFAAFTHAVWNFFTKKVSGNFTIFWYGLVAVNLLMLIYTVYSVITFGIESRAFIYILVSAAAHGLYYLALLYTYSRGDISTAYPIARGTGVAGTTMLSFFLLKEIIEPAAAIGIIAVFSGIVFIGLSRIKNQKRDIKSYIVSILTGIFIFTYSITDKLGVGIANPVVYVNILDLIALTSLAGFANPGGVKKSIKLVRANLKETLIIGIGSSGTYLIILFAMQLERASYIVSMREFSVVIASVMGFVFLKEKPTIFKITGITLITAGLVLIKLG